MPEVNGTTYHDDTPQEVITKLDELLHGRRDIRIRVWYGNEDGKPWMEEHDVMGYIGRSTGTKKIPLLVNNKRSYGGGALLDNRIIKIMTTDGHLLYQHPNFHLPEFKIDNISLEGYPEYTTGVWADGENVASFRKREQAERWVAFMCGQSKSYPNTSISNCLCTS